MTEVTTLLNLEVDLVAEPRQDETGKALAQKVNLDNLLSLLKDGVRFLNVDRSNDCTYPSHEGFRLLIEECHISVHGLIDLGIELQPKLAWKFINESFEIFLLSIVIVLDSGHKSIV